MNYREENFGDQGRIRHGSPTFYKLLEEMADTHDKKSHDYASDKAPSGNYHFAGMVAGLFSHSSQDAGFVGRIAEKIYRLANLEGGNKTALNEGIEDTERDICTITALWMSDRRDRRSAAQNQYNTLSEQPASEESRGHRLLTHEIQDLLKLMPDHQVDEILNFVTVLRQARAMRDAADKVLLS